MTDKRVPQFVKVIAVGVVVGLVVALGAAWWINRNQEAQEEDRCELSVSFRADTRAMWLWLGRQFPEGAEDVGLKEKLDELVPALYCDDGTLTPVHDEENDR